MKLFRSITPKRRRPAEESPEKHSPKIMEHKCDITDDTIARMLELEG